MSIFAKFLLNLTAFAPALLFFILHAQGTDFFYWVVGASMAGFVALLFLFWYIFDYMAKNAQTHSTTIKSIEINKEWLPMLALYAIPVVWLGVGPFAEYAIMMVSAVFVFMIALITATDIIHINPLVRLFGYNVYRAKDDYAVFTLISKKRLVRCPVKVTLVNMNFGTCLQIRDAS